MKENLHILVAADTEEQHQKLLKEVVDNAHIIIGNPSPILFQHCKKLAWLQLQSAGTNGYSDGEILPKDVLLSNGSGVYGLAISKFMLTTTLMMFKKCRHMCIIKANMHGKKKEKSSPFMVL